MSKDLKCGILGGGSIGIRHTKNLINLGYDVTVFDVAAARLDIAKQLGANVTKNRAKLLDKSDALFICTPSGQHYSDIEDGINSRCNLFVEKPITTKIQGLRAMLDLAKGLGLLVFAGFNLRFNKAVMRAQTILEMNKLGNILWGSFHSSHYLPDWRPDQDYREGYAADTISGGVIFDIIHEFDLANLFLGPAWPIASVARNTGKLGILSEDCADIILKHESGVQSVLHLDYVTRPNIRLIKIAGTKGVLSIDLINSNLCQLDTSSKKVINEDFKGLSINEEYIKQAKNFIDCIIGRTKPTCDGYEALELLKQVVEARKLAGLFGA